MASESENEQEALSWSLSLIRAQSTQHAEQQRHFLKHYLSLLNKRSEVGQPAAIPIPTVDVKHMCVVYGERPTEISGDLLTDSQTEVRSRRFQ